jgi:DNA-binding response OmpR family regulator
MQAMTDTRILMVEDEMCLAMMLEDVLSDAGYQVVRAARLKDAMNIARREHIDAAILDVNLQGEAVYPLATQLHESGVPFMFTSAYGRPGIPEEFHSYPVMPKPYPIHELIPAVEGLLETGDGYAANGAGGNGPRPTPQPH